MRTSTFLTELKKVAQEEPLQWFPLTLSIFTEEDTLPPDVLNALPLPSHGDPDWVWAHLKADAIIEISTDNFQRTFVGKFRSAHSSSAVFQALNYLNEHTHVPNEQKLALLEHLTEGAAQKALVTKANALDLNGNYIIQGKSHLFWRSGKEAKHYKDSLPFNVYGGQSAQVGRIALQTNPLPTTLKEWQDVIKKQGGSLALSTISKALKEFRQDLIISKTKQHLIQPERLLTKLLESYSHPININSIKLKLPHEILECEDKISQILGNNWIWGEEKTAATLTNSIPPVSSHIYTDVLPPQIATWETERFSNCTVHVCEDNLTYFGKNGHWMSPIESYLRLSVSDVRAQELAEDLSHHIISQTKAHQ